MTCWTVHVSISKYCNWQSSPYARFTCSWDGPSSGWLHTHAAAPWSAGVAGRGIASHPPGRWRAGHPDLVRQGTALLKVAAVGWDPLWATAHGGSSVVASWSLKYDGRKIKLGLVCALLCPTAVPLRLISLPVTVDSGFIAPVVSYVPSLARAAQFMN